ncbi:hypothetical protein UN96_12355 [Acinetobacter baumannii]|uniref:hypothetical protein n=1 Tax=Acinetobacter baumannii TaxID=470 RepID=UPI00062C351E|nr:hypothetical protein [Acinetobacter baumannii]EJB8489897.1 hypothetical protein [Acinetobacter baumannii]KKZ30516.1 hypothetical protein UN96_12355 [Acinetobacter baumannii]
MATQRQLIHYADHPFWSGQLYIPFLQKSVGVNRIEDTLQFTYHGMNYSINLNQKGTLHSDGSLLVAIARKPKFRTIRKPIGLPSHTSIYFMTHQGKCLSARDVDSWSSYQGAPTAMMAAFHAAAA